MDLPRGAGPSLEPPDICPAAAPTELGVERLAGASRGVVVTDLARVRPHGDSWAGLGGAAACWPTDRMILINHNSPYRLGNEL